VHAEVVPADNRPAAIRGDCADRLQERRREQQRAGLETLFHNRYAL
jgi:hypothetical protein